MKDLSVQLRCEFEFYICWQNLSIELSPAAVVGDALTGGRRDMPSGDRNWDALAVPSKTDRGGHFQVRAGSADGLGTVLYQFQTVTQWI